MKTGYQNSRFAHQVHNGERHLTFITLKKCYVQQCVVDTRFYFFLFPQVERFACLYGSQVTNFGLYSPNKYYRPSEDYMPHEFDVLEL